MYVYFRKNMHTYAFIYVDTNTQMCLYVCKLCTKTYNISCKRRQHNFHLQREDRIESWLSK